MQQLISTLNVHLHLKNIDADSILLSAETFETPLGHMLVIADDKALYYCDFVDNPHRNEKIERVLKKANATLVQDTTEAMRLFERELQEYFAGKLRKFTTPVALFGTDFTVKVWRALQTIPYGRTVSYAQLAAAVGKPTACRAVANANGMNVLPIIIPCHRVINANGGLGGYNSGLERKIRLLEHENKHFSSKQ